MKSVLLVGLFGVLFTSALAKSAEGGPESRAEVIRGQERGDKGHGGGHGGGQAGGHGGGGGGGGEGHGHVMYHETAGQELFQGEEVGANILYMYYT